MSDTSSEESDHFDGLVQEQHDTESDSGASDSRPDEDDDDAESASDEGLMSNALFDMSAEEADDTGSDDEDDGSASDDHGHDDDGLDGYVNRIERSESPPLHFFPQFKRLPTELRYRIWELFCPEILAKGRVYPLTLRRVGDGMAHLYSDVHLGMMTESSRAVLAVHRESRQFALAAFPDILCFQDGATSRLRFNKEKDIILVDYKGHTAHWPPLESKSMNQVRNIALLCNPGSSHTPDWSHFSILKFWENPGAIYIALEANEVCWDSRHQICSIKWCGERDHHHYRAYVRELQEHGLGEDLGYHWVWPNLDKHPDYEEYWFKEGETDYTHQRFVDEILDYDPADWDDVGENSDLFISREEVKTKFVPVFRPLIVFYEPDDDRLFNRLARTADRGPDGDDFDSEQDDDDSDELDEYESEGIDDSDIEEPDEHSEDDDLIVRDDDDDGGSGSDGDSGSDGESTFAGFSPLQEHSGPARFRAPPEIVDLDHDDEEARFSSPELDEDESQTVRGSDSEEDEDLPRRRPRARGSRSRSRVVESADEDERPAESAPKVSKRKRVLDSDDEDEATEDDDGDAPRKRTRTSKASRLVVPDDDSENDEDGKEEHGHYSLPDSEEDDESDDEVEDEDVEPAARPLTLMERLELHRRDNPTPGDEEDDEDPDMEEMGQDDYDARNYGVFEDDDEGMEPSDAGDGEGIDYDEVYDEGEEEYY